jgi:hypothetical protein
LVFKVASQNSISFNVSVNGSNVGTVSREGTGGWDTYAYVTLNSQVQLSEGVHTITLNFTGPVNIDYFLLVGEATGVRYGAASVIRTRSQITLKPGARGFTAMLPTGHGYTSYKLINLRGRQIKSGPIASGAADLRFNNLEKGVLFLRLEGKGNARTVVRATTL